MELIDWLRKKSPALPVVIARASQTPGELVEHCRTILFQDCGLPPVTERRL